MSEHKKTVPLDRKPSASSVTISGRPSATWAVLTDPLWLAQWLPGVRSVEGDFRLHGKLRVTALNGEQFSIHVDDMTLERRLKLRVHRTTLIVAIDPLSLSSRRVTFTCRSRMGDLKAVPPPSILAERFASLFRSDQQT